MNFDMNYRQRTVVIAALVGSAVVIIGYLAGAIVPAAIFVAIQAIALGLVLWLTRPRSDLVTLSHAAAQSAASESDVIVYWMPG